MSRRNKNNISYKQNFYWVYTMQGLFTNPDYTKTLVNASKHDKQILQKNFINYSQLHRDLIKEYIKKEKLK